MLIVYILEVIYLNTSIKNAEMKNKDRFLGFADVYDQVRPGMPEYPIEIITKYLNKKADVVVDLGCGSGLSTIAWKNHCNAVIGIEPSDDMFLAANQKADHTISFKKSFAHETGLSSDCADAVICSQSFHWMDPELTLAEVNRILKTGGVFAAVDYDWPPVCKWEAEAAHKQLFYKVSCLEEEHGDLKESFIRWDKNKHLSNIINSGYFRYQREIVFANRELCDAKRFIGMALSQSGLQSIIQHKPHLIKNALDEYTETIQCLFAGETMEADFCYRMRLGIK
ncbi:MAG TPA: class I SAM-dependent methyltransferase [Lachnoclostridium sp.]|uniref:class I SAM-dependent methyltransferase n=1 Tax=Lacrimispora sp. TaxID=2719234 RepID=UPI000EE4B779|nr:class I SAM-dependent methyltransferase [Lacrimispora sp.]HCD44708.1 class I SAM-dependent methyltransferase [Lachnoclostridium sp.]